VGLVEKVFWCVPTETPLFAWQGHEIYFLLIILIIPGGVMSAAYGAIAHKICQCMQERRHLIGATFNNDCKEHVKKFDKIKVKSVGKLKKTKSEVFFRHKR